MIFLQRPPNHAYLMSVAREWAVVHLSVAGIHGVGR